MKKLTKEHKEAMKEIKNGGDVFSYVTALRLREVQKIKPSALIICEAMGDYPGAVQRPYFGAILTRKGKRMIEALDLPGD